MFRTTRGVITTGSIVLGGGRREAAEDDRDPEPRKTDVARVRAGDGLRCRTIASTLRLFVLSEARELLSLPGRRGAHCWIGADEVDATG